MLSKLGLALERFERGHDAPRRAWRLDSIGLARSFEAIIGLRQVSVNKVGRAVVHKRGFPRRAKAPQSDVLARAVHARAPHARRRVVADAAVDLRCGIPGLVVAPVVIFFGTHRR